MEPRAISSLKPLYDRAADALKVLGAGNATGLLSVGAALNTFTSGPHVFLWLKLSAVCFAIGVFTFAVCYFAFVNAYIQKGGHELQAADMTEKSGKYEASRYTESGAKAVKWMFVFVFTAWGSTASFFIAFALAFVALVTL